METTYRIPRRNMPQVIKQLGKVSRIAKRAGMVFEYTIGTAYQAEVNAYFPAGDGRVINETVTAWVCDVTVPEITYRLGDWQIVATKQAQENTALIFTTIEGHNVEAYRNNSMHCEHCQQRRNRHSVAILHNGTEYKQVGTTCLESYTGVNPAAILSLYQSVNILREQFGEAMSYRLDRAPVHYPVIDWVAAAIMAINEQGEYVSSDAAHFTQKLSTKETTAQILNTFDGTQDTTEAQQVISTILSGEPSSDFERNMVAICQSETVSAKHVGILTYAPILAQKITRKQAEANQAPSEYIGQIKDRIEVTVTVTKVIGFETAFGWMDVNIMKDTSGNVLVWKSGSSDLEEGKTYSGKVTVKDHEEYRGVKQTIITRCKFD